MCSSGGQLQLLFYMLMFQFENWGKNVTNNTREPDSTLAVMLKPDRLFS